jgi:hypothetical protein
MSIYRLIFTLSVARAGHAGEKFFFGQPGNQSAVRSYLEPVGIYLEYGRIEPFIAIMSEGVYDDFVNGILVH